MADSKGKKILVVEDDEFLSNTYRSKLEKEGYEVAIVHDGTEVVKTAIEFSPNLILLDIILPRMGGDEALEKLKAEEKTKDIPVLVASNLGNENIVDKCLELGAVDYFVKANISIDELIDKCKEFATS